MADSLSASFQNAMSYLQEQISGIQNDVNGFVEETNELFFSYDPNSERSMLLEEIMTSEDAWDLAINLVAQDQLLNHQITPWGAPMPEYKPRTIRYKVQRGFPPEWRVRYTEYDTGTFYNHGINVVVVREKMKYGIGIHNIDQYPYFAYIPEEYIDLTPQNLAFFERTVGSWLNERLVQEWFDRNM